MVLVTLMWSIAGVVTRHLEAARSFEVTFWRSGFNALALAVALTWMRGAALWTGLLRARWPLWVSALCWAVMYTAFMVAITLTSVANVLITMSLAPLMTALFARALLGHRVALRTWIAIAAAGAGIAWMFASEVAGAQPGALVGTLVAFAVPLAAATNWTVLQHIARGRASQAPDMLAAVLIGALISAAATLPLAWPLQASAHDVGLLALLGVRSTRDSVFAGRAAHARTARTRNRAAVAARSGVWRGLGMDRCGRAAVVGSADRRRRRTRCLARQRSLRVAWTASSLKPL